MRNSHRRIGSVNALTAGAACAENINSQIVGVYVNLNFLNLGKNRNGNR